MFVAIISCLSSTRFKKTSSATAKISPSKKIKVPVIAHGGAGNFKHISNVIKKTNISFVNNKIPLKCKIDDWFVYSVKAGSHYSAALAVNAEIDHHPCYDFRSLQWQD